MKFTETSVSATPEVLKRMLGAEYLKPIVLDNTAFTNGVCAAGTAVAVKNGSTVLASFTIPTGYSPSSGGGFRVPGGPGGGPGGGSGFSYLLSCPGLTSGTSYTVTIGSTSASCKASTSYSGR